MNELMVGNQGAIAKRNPLQLYLREIARYPLLEPQEEFLLAKDHFENGTIEAAHRLITANLRLVVKIASDFKKSYASFLDLIQEGNRGLMHAVKKFNPYRGVKLSSYAAWWIKSYILKFIMNNESQVKLVTTNAQKKLYYKLKSTAAKILSLGQRADAPVLAEVLQVKEAEVLEMQRRLYGTDLPLDANARQVELLHDSAPSIEDELVRQQQLGMFRSCLGGFCQTLNDRDKEIVELRLLSDNPMSLQEIGEKYSMSRQRAHQLEKAIKDKLRVYVQEQGINHTY